MQTFIFVLILILAVIASQPLARVLKIVPLPVLQIAIGAALAWPVTGGVHVEIEPELFLLLFIPPLLFADAWQAPKREFRKLLRPILSLAFGLVFFTILAFGYLLHWLVPAMPIAVAFALAAVLSPTDAVAVSSIVDKNAVPKDLLHILEGEALLNDASGLVMFRFATAAALTGSFSLYAASTSFAFAVAGGIGAGFLSLFLVSKTLRLLTKFDGIAPEAQVLVMLLLPFIAYLLAESWHASGILAAVIAGLNIGRLRAFDYLGVSARMLTTAMWAMLSFVFNGAIFVLLGLQLPAIIRTMPAELISHYGLLEPILVVVALTLCLILLRYFWISIAIFLGGIVNRLLRLSPVKVSARTRLAGSVAGVRGAVTLAGVLSLPLVMPDGSAFPARDLAIFIAAGVILCWLAIATLFLPPIVSGLAKADGAKEVVEERRARIAMAQAAIEKLEGLAHNQQRNEDTVTVKEAAAEGMIAQYRRRMAALDEGETVGEDAQAARWAEMDLRQVAVDAEREAVRAMLRRGEIDDETSHKLYRDIALTEALVASRTKKK